MQRIKSLGRPLIKVVSKATYEKVSITKPKYQQFRGIGSFIHTARPPILSNTFGNRFLSGSIVVPLESLGDSITSAVIVSWNKQAGDLVKEDDVIAVVETDKVTMDIRSKSKGVFVEGLVPKGSEIAVGAPLYKIEEGGSAAPSGSPEKAAAPAAAVSEAPKVVASAAPQVVAVPIMGESITSGVLAKWFVGVGDVVKPDAVVASIETDKVTVEVHSPFGGRVTELFSKEGAEVNVGNPLFTVTEGSFASSPAAAAPAAPKAAATPKEAVPIAAPVVKPTAPTPAAPAPPAASASIAVAAASARGETRVKMTRMRQRIAQRLKEAQNTAAMLTTFQEVDMTNLLALRSKYKDDFEKLHGVKLGFMGAFVKAATAALQEIPSVNAVIDDSTQEVVYHNYVDVSVAVAAPTGLVVPVLRNTNNMTIADVERNIAAYSKKAKDGALALEDMSGGTFTISNGGVFGSLFGTPIINPPQSAILGIHATKLRPMVVDGKVEPRPMMYLALTYDHRLVDGREAVTFLKSVANKIEDPVRLLLGL